MANKCYETKRLRAESMQLVLRCRRIVESYQADGLRLTLRQLYYQLVTQNAIPNEERSYKMLGKLLSNARLSGLIDWDAIEDRTRVPRRPSEFEDLVDLINVAVASYRLPRLADQPNYVEVWVEKDALAGVLYPVTEARHVTLMVNRGYSSQSAMQEAAVRIDRACRGRDGLRCAAPTVLYIGDHDPSGEDMVRDVSARLNDFMQGWLSPEEVWAVGKTGDRTKAPVRSPSGSAIERVGDALHVEVRKLALTMDQVDEYQPPPNPAKHSDSRAGRYVAEHGDSSWEVDALPPKVLQGLIEEALEELIDQDLVDPILEQEKDDIARLRSLVGGDETAPPVDDEDSQD